MINVTKSYLPPFSEYEKYLKQIWESHHLTNNGPLVQELEKKLKEYLRVKHLLFTGNGTVVLQMALKVFGITKEVITTPFSYVATVNAILWEGCTPVFVDINEKNFCVDAEKIETKITKDTQAILVTHVYGYPCDIEKIETLAKKHNLKVIYDGAHAFGCMYRGKPLLSYGDISTCSFHATKPFHTIEGGCIVSNHEDTHRQLTLFRQFGHSGDDYYSEGINAKNSEFHAAMGLCNFPGLLGRIARRKILSELYDSQLKDTAVRRQQPDENLQYGYSYYPIVFATEEILLSVKKALEQEQIFPRRYFYPSLNQLPYLKPELKSSCPVAEEISRTVLCLPLYIDLEETDVTRISGIIRSVIG